MRTLLAVFALAAPLAGLATLWSPAEDGPDAPGSAESPPPAEEALPSRQGVALRVAPPRPAVVTPEPPPDPGAADWAAALVASESGRVREAFSLAKQARAKSPAYFKDKGRLARWKEMEAAAVSAEAALAALRLAALERAAGDPQSDRRLTREEREALNATFAKMVDVIADAQTAEERAALLRHARRFLLPPSAFRGDGVSSRLGALSRGRKKGGPEEPLPADDDDTVEARRVEQLERLRQRDLVSLLDRIHAALAWLALHQADDGRFSDGAVRERCKKLGHPACVGEGNDTYAVATTALAVCAFLDFRDQDALGLFEPTLGRGIAWLLKRQAADGSFPGAGQTYTSAVALMALAQAAGSTGRQDVRDAVGRGLAWFASMQHEGGGFRYGRRQPGDLSATGWVAQAVAAAKASGIAVPPSLEPGMGRFLESVWIGDQRFGYLDDRRESGSLGPVGMLTGLLVWRDTPNSTLGSWRGSLEQPVRNRGLYWVYYAVRVGLALDEGLSPSLRKAVDALVAKQSTKGDTAGAFPGRLDNWLHRGGTALQTAVVVLTLEHALFLR